ncbi:hypothetical protein, partial [Microbacterium sp. CPCC 204701]|uniref:hypothetical protein n=1 Tax=Microbacterium sp. CPCC 204701 TaxID=2493084 RepID=UPI0013E40898
VNRARTVGAAALILAGALCAGALAPAPTEAAWTHREVASDATLQAGTVMPPPNMTCATGLLILAPVTFSWSAPTGGLTRSSYRWTVTGSLNGSGVLAANATSVTLSSGLLGLGTGTFSLYAVGPGGWESSPKTGTLSFLTGLLSSCSVR